MEPSGEQTTSKAAYQQACAYLQQRQIALAADKFEEALRLGWNPVMGLTERWTTRMLLGEFEKAWPETDKIELRRRQGDSVDGGLVWDGSDFVKKRPAAKPARARRCDSIHRVNVPNVRALDRV